MKPLVDRIRFPALQQSVSRDLQTRGPFSDLENGCDSFTHIGKWIVIADLFQLKALLNGKRDGQLLWHDVLH